MLQRARAVGRGFEVEGVLDDWMSMLHPRRRMQTLVEQLKQRGYCVYYLSNIPEDVLDLLMHRDFEGLFDGGVASCEVKVNKPDPRIYQALLDKYGLKASECVFILLCESLVDIPQSVAQIERYTRNSHRLLHNNVDIKCQRQ